MDQMINVVEGKFAKHLSAQKNLEYLGLVLGLTTKTIYLNGGSDTRKGSREFWEQFAKNHNIEFSSCGWKVILGKQYD
jgi:hypothetical protein